MADRSPAHRVATALAHALLADAEQPAGRSRVALLARLRACLGVPATPALHALTHALARQPLPFWRRHTVPTLAAALQAWPSFRTLIAAQPLRVRQWLLKPARMRDQPLGLALPLPDWPTPADVARGLNLGDEQLHWLTHPALAWRAPSPGTRAVAPHYRCLLLPKARGGLRLIEVPLPLTKRVQRQLLARLLAHVPPHEAAHGFVRGRDVASHAALHAGQPFIAAFDLRDFFTCIGAARITAVWRTLGYPEGTARTLTALTTTRTPAPVRARLREAGGLSWLHDRRLASAHLPQGAPTSPALANLCAFGLDLRLAGLAERFGARYSRYADDLVFSGPAALGGRFRVLHAWVEAIARAEGFALHPAKTRRLPAHRRQRLTGLVVNQRPNLARDDYDRLRAELHQLARQASVEGARRAPLLGRLAWAARFVCASRAAKLRRLFAQIVFEGHAPQDAI